MCFPSTPSEERGGEVLSPSPSPRLQNWTPPEAWPGQGKWHPEIKKAEGKEKKKQKEKKNQQKIKKRKQKESARGPPPAHVSRRGISALCPSGPTLGLALHRVAALAARHQPRGRGEKAGKRGIDLPGPSLIFSDYLTLLTGLLFRGDFCIK
uniref:Uncharacterized protein n=1 Tax=Myotis myotis TaxID=51298 RepID=A0A7J7S1W1_MYOMY|nr:hypothetical protein mMyoMyo1_010078 [Myotis myotis]